MTSTTDSVLAVRWIKLPKINAKAILLIAMAALLSILSRHLFRSGLSDAIANDHQYAPLKYFRPLPLISISNITCSIP